MQAESAITVSGGLRTWHFVVSFVAHGLVVGLIAASKGCEKQEVKPLFNPDEVMQVQMVAMMPVGMAQSTEADQPGRSCTPKL